MSPKVLASWVAGAALWLGGTSAATAGTACPSPTDVRYTVKALESLSEITRKAYCLDDSTGFAALKEAWPIVYEHNRERVGPNAHRVYLGTELCLPQIIETSFRRVSICGPNACGNDRREDGEMCDGRDLAGMNCEALGRPSGRLACADDCSAYDSSACVDESPDPPAEATESPPKKPATPPPRRPPPPVEERSSRRVEGEFMVGFVTPVSARAWQELYRPSVIAALGARIRLGWLEVAPRFLAMGGGHATVFNGMEQEQEILGAGGSLQAGIPIGLGSIRLTPGVEGTLLFIQRSINREDYPFEQEMEEQGGSIPSAGAYLRADYVFRSKQAITLGLEISSDVMLATVADMPWSDKFSMKALGGLGYEF